MKTVTTKIDRTWVLQAYLAINPSCPRWSDVLFTAIEGWADYQCWSDGHKLWRDPRLTPAYSRWEFISAEAAQEVLNDLLCRKQKYHLRVIERMTVLTEQVVSGCDIEEGQVVEKLDRSGPAFIGKSVKGCANAMPRMLCS